LRDVFNLDRVKNLYLTNTLKNNGAPISLMLYTSGEVHRSQEQLKSSVLMYLSRVDASSSKEREKKMTRPDARSGARLGQNGCLTGEEKMWEKWEGVWIN